MPVEHVVHADDPRLEPYRALPAHDARRRAGTFVAETRAVVRQLLASRHGVSSVLLTAEVYRVLADDLASRPEVPVLVVPLAVLKDVVGFDFHRGCLALGERGPERTLDDVLAPRPERLVVLDGASNPDNVGGVLRVAHALGADAVVLSPDSCDPLYRKVIRVSLGAALLLPWTRVESWDDTLARLRAAGFALLALTPGGDTDVAALEETGGTTPTALLVGAEGDGLRASTLAAAQRRLRIPMAAGRDSLNLVTACAIALDRLGWARMRRAPAVARGPGASLASRDPMPEFNERFFRSGTLRIHFREWGDPAAPPLVIVHGLRDHSHSFDGLARGLRDRFHVFALDLRGHGDSETTPYYDFGHFVLDLHNLVRALRLERPVLVGHSMGGEIIATYAGAFPDRPSRVVMIEGLGPPPIDMQEEVRWTIDGFARVDRALAGHPGLADLDAAYRRLRERNPRLPEAMARELALLGTRAREDGTLEWKFDAMLATLSLGGPFNLEYVMAWWRRIAVPVLVVHGAESGEFWRGKAGAPYLDPDDLARRLACFQDARFVEIAGAGHMVHFDRLSELVAEIRAFLLDDGAARAAR